MAQRIEEREVSLDDSESAPLRCIGGLVRLCGGGGRMRRGSVYSLRRSHVPEVLSGLIEKRGGRLWAGMALYARTARRAMGKVEDRILGSSEGFF